jgi:NhaP-type Na+/H+ or K+/H+ antiporter
LEIFLLSINIIFVIILLGGLFFGDFFEKIKLPNVLGMVIFGIILSLTIKDKTPKLLFEIEPFLKSMALIVILLRSGLGISRKTLNKTGKTALLMSFIPCIFEGISLTFLFHHFFEFSYTISGLTAFMLSAVSPAVIVPSMLDLKEKGFSKHKDVPTIILAGASIDDVFAITIFSTFLSLSLTKDINIFNSIIHIPISLISGIIIGTVIGFILINYFKINHQKLRATKKTLILLTISIMTVQIGEFFDIAALLSIMTIGFILLEKSDEIANELSLKLSKVWIFAQIILFVLIGFSLDINVAYKAGLKGALIIFIGLIFRSIGVLIATHFSNLNFKEKLFCIFAYLPKATVQAALGSVALSYGINEGDQILALAVLSIILTAPLGLILINSFSKKLL